MNQIRMGFIGCGGNASSHIGRVLEFPDVDIVALADIDGDSIERLRNRYEGVKDIPVFRDHAELLENIELDAVEISTPHTLHYQQIMASLDRGLHVLCEKPMVCRVKHAHDVIAKSQEVDKVLMVSYQRHLAAEFRFVRNQIQCGELGDIQFVSALQDQGWYHGTQGTWRQQMALSGGGQLNDSGSHLLDVMLWMTGLEVADVQACMENFESEVDINSAMTVKFTNGALGNISIVGNSPVSGMWEDITIWGTKAVVYMRNGQITYKEATGETRQPTDLPGGSTPDRNFVDAIFGRDEVQVPAQCGLRVIELTEAAWESARTGVRADVVRS